jgi:NAD(P)H-dependent FMN reductase
VNSKRAVRVVAISGSLRRASSNSAVIEAVARLVAETVEVSIYRELAELPPFNPDLDTEEPPMSVVAFRHTLRTCDAVLISCPEYAHGVPGVLKNALDWVVGSGELIGKPVALLNTSPRATHAWSSLAETLTVMSARVISAASITLSIQSGALNAAAIAADAELAAALTSAIDALIATIALPTN